MIWVTPARHSLPKLAAFDIRMPLLPRQQCSDCSITGSHLARMPLGVEQDELLQPGNIRLLRAIGKMHHAADIGHLVDDSRFRPIRNVASCKCV